jgi:hypothetical protein
MAQIGENLHVTIQNTNHTVVAHYFYKKTTNSWRYNAYQGGGVPPIPYGNHTHVNLRAVQTKGVDFAWPPGNITLIQGSAKPAQHDKKAKKKAFADAKKLANKRDMDDLFGSKSNSSNSSNSSAKLGDLKPVRFPEPPGGIVTDTYMTGLIARQDRDSLLYLYRSWPLSKWESAAWSRFLEWVTGPDS